MANEKWQKVFSLSCRSLCAFSICLSICGKGYFAKTEPKQKTTCNCERARRCRVRRAHTYSHSKKCLPKKKWKRTAGATVQQKNQKEKKFACVFETSLQQKQSTFDFVRYTIPYSHRMERCSATSSTVWMVRVKVCLVWIVSLPDSARLCRVDAIYLLFPKRKNHSVMLTCERGLVVVCLLHGKLLTEWKTNSSFLCFLFAVSIGEERKICVFFVKNDCRHGFGV